MLLFWRIFLHAAVSAPPENALEAIGNARSDHFVKDRRSEMSPQRKRASDQSRYDDQRKNERGRNAPAAHGRRLRQRGFQRFGKIRHIPQSDG